MAWDSLGNLLWFDMIGSPLLLLEKTRPSPGSQPPRNLGFCVVAQVQPELPHWRKHWFHELNFGDKRIRSRPLLWVAMPSSSVAECGSPLLKKNTAAKHCRIPHSTFSFLPVGCCKVLMKKDVLYNNYQELKWINLKRGISSIKQRAAETQHPAMPLLPHFATPKLQLHPFWCELSSLIDFNLQFIQLTKSWQWVTW